MKSHSHTIITLCIFTFALCACSAVPKIATPDGSHRIPVNTPSAIDDYRASLNTGSSPRDQAALVRQIEAMKREIAELKQLLASEAKAGRRQARQVKAEGTTGIPMMNASLRKQVKRQRPPTIIVPAVATTSNRSAL
jgi:hypothetical protein